MYHGKYSMAKWNSVEIDSITSISVSFEANTEETSPHNSDNTKNGTEFTAGRISKTVTVEAYVGDSNNFQASKGEKQTLDVYRASTDTGVDASAGYYTGTAICENVSTGLDVDGFMTVTYEFRYITSDFSYNTAV